MQKVSIIPHFTPKHTKMGVNRHFQAKQTKYSPFRIIGLLQWFQILRNNKDLQVLFMGGPKICPTNPRWWTAAILKKMWNCYISAPVWPILMKFCTLTLIGTLVHMSCWNIQKLRNPIWWTAAILKKTLNAIYPQPFDWFWWHLVWWCILTLPTWWATKNFKFWKFNMADGCHLENRKSRYIQNCLADLFDILHDDAY